MIIGNILEFVLNLLLAPITVIDIGVNWLLGIEWVVDVINITAYVLPWSNILPLIFLVIAVFMFRIVIALIKTIWDLLPLA